MKNIKKLIVIEGILFFVAGVITFLVGKFTFNGYGTILFFIGAVTMAIGVFSQLGPDWHRPMVDLYKPKISVSQQHLRDIKDMESNISFFLSLFIVGIIPAVIGLILMQL
jgi:isoprenylcysteine carboxyl methyltransferase (ICMT) family protein YpbQ